MSLAMMALPLLSFGQAWSIDDCVEYAISHNPEILHRQLQHDTQKEVLDEVSAGRMPVISLGVQETLHSGNTLLMYSVDENLTMSLTQMAATLEMPLVSGGRIPNTKAAEEYRLKASAENIAVSKTNVRIRVAAACMQLLNDMSQERIAREQLELCGQEVRYVTTLVNEGRRTGADLAEARAALSSADYTYTAAKSNALLSKVNLANLIGLEDVEGFELEELDATVEDTREIPLLPLLGGIENQPAVMSAKYNMTSAEYRVKAARGALFPQLSLFANYNNYFVLPIGYKDFHMTSQPDKTGWGAIGLKLSVPILNMTANRQVSRARLAVEDARVTLDESRLELSKRFREAHYQTMTAREKYESSLRAESAALESYESQKKLYDAGRSTTYDLDQSRLRWFTASQEVTRSKYEYLLRNRILGYYSDHSQD